MTEWQDWEERFLVPAATLSRTAVRARAEADCPLRTPFQRDRDRIIHSKAFRRLKHKAQVFVNPSGDHFRTRLTHTLEVMQIARTVSRALHLNEDLTEAIAMGHDLGHTPFGHAGERALNRVIPGFSHNEQGVRVVTLLERDGAGLNLTLPVVDGIRCHSGAQLPATPEGAVVRLSDRIAYLNHDIDDAMRSGFLRYEQIPADVTAYLGNTSSRRINTMVADVVEASRDLSAPRMSDPCAAIMNKLREFMFSTVYFHPRKIEEEAKLEELLLSLYDYYTAHPDRLPAEHASAPDEYAVCDYIAGMTDNFALETASSLGLRY